MSGRMFRPFPVESGIVWRVNDSDITRWSMFIGTKIGQALVQGDLRTNYMNWIDRLYRIIIGSPASQELTVPDLIARLSGLRELSGYAYMISSNARGYALFKKGTPYFLQIASTFPTLWAPNSAIFIAHALQCKQYELRAFTLVDTVSSLAFGIPPLLHYDTTPFPIERVENSQLLEWVYGCPPDIVILLAKINAWRASRWIESPAALLNTEEWIVVEKVLNCWTATIDHTDGSSDLVLRLAIQESWRQAVFIYLYMAAAATRHESHRAFLRTKVHAARNENIWILRGADFVPVLDHLWHGVGAGGAPVRWDDYVDSRCAVLPLGVDT
ncbi:hypothetical protein BDV93DRAFT_564895 [Ceratobasidium sp. AG-I]|nr:hypothetical protein BDV93DRAFT_564895 [Ceratobasidium sp. AG-I]